MSAIVETNREYIAKGTPRSMELTKAPTPLTLVRLEYGTLHSSGMMTDHARNAQEFMGYIITTRGSRYRSDEYGLATINTPNLVNRWFDALLHDQQSQTNFDLHHIHYTDGSTNWHTVAAFNTEEDAYYPLQVFAEPWIEAELERDFTAE